MSQSACSDSSSCCSSAEIIAPTDAGISDSSSSSLSSSSSPSHSAVALSEMENTLHSLLNAFRGMSALSSASSPPELTSSSSSSSSSSQCTIAAIDDSGAVLLPVRCSAAALTQFGALYTRLEHWIGTHAPCIALEPPAVEQQVQYAEQFLGVEYPDDYRASLAHHNGQSWESPALLGRWNFLDIRHSLAEAEDMKDMLDMKLYKQEHVGKHNRIKQIWWNRSWIPIAQSNWGFICIDMDPVLNMHQGQIIMFIHDHPQRFVLADSFSAWFSSIIHDLEQGLYTFDCELQTYTGTAEAFLHSAAEQEREQAQTFFAHVLGADDIANMNDNQDFRQGYELV